MPVRPTEQHQHESSVGEGDDTNTDVHLNVTGDTNVNANVNANANMSPEGVHILGGEFGTTANQSTFREGAPALSSVVISPTRPSRNSPLCGCELAAS
jgi:hypothetical protein